MSYKASRSKNSLNLARYTLAGIVTTAASYLVFASLYTLLSLLFPFLAYAISFLGGYVTGLVIGFFMQRYYVWSPQRISALSVSLTEVQRTQKSSPSKSSFSLYLYYTSYTLATLILGYAVTRGILQIAHIDPRITQLALTPCFAVIGYFVSRKIFVVRI